MNEIVLKPPSSAQAVKLVSILLKNGFNPTDAIIKYSLKEHTSVKLSNVKDFPLILTGTLDSSPIRVAVSQLEVGRYCEGAYALRKILKEAGFYIEEKDLFTIRCFNKDTGRLKLTISKR